ncbi:restriction endonuclease subunit S [Micrococcus lacusdianchii]|uniref:restriction endonuclease subunit S n=1 Tax=Micrococcus lacusdianchii TaxID=2915940 RepID=UPI002003E058|nr:restriction endonuclease subunit S [Micrococcus sp. JXJ CY 30]
MGDLLFEISERPGGHEEIPVLTLTEKRGFVLQGERFSKRLATEDTSRYKLIQPGTFAFNPYLLWAGALAMNDLGFSGVASPLYPTFRVREGLDESYVYRILSDPGMVARYDSVAFGSVPRRRRTSVKDFLSLHVPELPSLDEQRRIAAILDRADARRSRRRAQVDYLEVLIRSRLAAVVAHAPTGPALGDVAGFVRGVTFKPADVSNEGVPVMRTKNVQKRLDLSDVIRIPADLVRNEDKYLRPGDTLVSSANSYNLVGKCCFVGELPERSAIGGFVAALRPGPDVDPMFLYHWFNSDRIQETVRSFGNQTTNISNLNIKRTLTLRLPDVPLSVQREFAAVVAKVDAQRERIERALALEDELFASLQYRAFRGEL